MTSVMGEGDTPLISLPFLAERWGLGALYAKAEYLNPTGSYKDRIAATTIAEAVRRGRRGWIGTSSGNGGAAMSAYGRRAGLHGVLCVSANAPIEKFASIRPYGVTMFTVRDMGDHVMDLLEDIAEQENLQLTITTHAHNAAGMVGARDIGEEIADQGASVSHVYVPTGGGGLLVAIAAGLARAGKRIPVIVAQPSGCAPISGFVNQQLDRPVVGECTTRISGLQLPSPPDGLMAATEVRSSGGWGAAVPDPTTWRAQQELATTEGVFVEPASAVALAAVQEDARSGRIGRSDSPCVILTGSGLKDLSRFSAPVRPADVIPVDSIRPRVLEAFPPPPPSRPGRSIGRDHP